MASTDRPTPPGPATDSSPLSPEQDRPPAAASQQASPAPAVAPGAASPGPAARPAERGAVGTGWFWSLILGVVLALAIVVFVLQNSDPVTVEFLGWQGDVSLAGLLLVVALAAIVLDELFGAFYRHRRRRRLNAPPTAARSRSRT